MGWRSRLRYILTSLALVAVLVAFWISDLFELVQDTSLELSASVAAFLLSLLGESAYASGTNLVSARMGVRIGEGCDALLPFLVYAAVVLVSPVQWLLRGIAVLGGAVVLVAINQLRIISLYFTGIHYPAAFDVMHRDVWQVLFIALMLGTYVVWAVWALDRQTARR